MNQFIGGGGGGGGGGAGGGAAGGGGGILPSGSLSCCPCSERISL